MKTRQLGPFDRERINQALPGFVNKMREQLDEDFTIVPRYEFCFPYGDKFACYADVFYEGGKTEKKIVFDLDTVEMV